MGKLREQEINACIVTKFSWSIARVSSYLHKYKKDALIHGPMVWCIRNCVELIAQQSIINVFTLEQLSTICWSISICGQPVTLDNHRFIKHYIDLFEYIVSNTWEIVDCRLESDPQFYLNILSALLSFKDVIVRKEDKNELNDVDSNKMLVDVEEDEDSDMSENVTIDEKI